LAFERTCEVRIACWQLAFYGVLTSLVSDPAPLGEELGWRGFALPRLLQGRSALSASVILGLIWGSGTCPLSWAVGDFYGDGLPDLVVANAASHDLSVLLCLGDGTFQAARSIPAGKTPFAVLVGDFNHHLLTDAHGIPLAISLTGANRHDVTQLLPLLDKVPRVKGKRGAPRCRPDQLQGRSCL
jgi:FG-GAP-like repeat/Transposase DDE domain/Type II CAAX prenyl endopeptidase Rce1-like